MSAHKSKAEAELELSIEHALRTLAPGESLPFLANRVFDNEPRLIALLTRPWFIERIVRMMERKLNQFTPDKQMRLPIPGLTLPPRIPTAPRQPPRNKVELSKATLPQLVAYRKLLVQKKDGRIEQLDQLIAFMRKHAKRSRSITLGEVLEKHGQSKLNFSAAAGV